MHRGEALLFTAFWLILSGHYTGLHLSLGALSIVLVVWVAWNTRRDDQMGLSLQQWLRLPIFVVWLAVEVLRSAVAVARQVWMPRPNLEPDVGLTPADDLTEITQVIYANSITLTPGTLAMELVDTDIRVHTLQPSGLSSLQAGRMLQRVRRLEGR